MNTAEKKVPVLRFPEFQGEWEEKKLGNVATDIMYGMNSAATEFDGINKYLRITDIDEESRTFSPNPLTSPEGELRSKYKLKIGDIVFARTGASTGKSYLYNENDGNLFFAGFLIKFNIIKAVPYFIYLITLRDTYAKWVQIMSMRSGQPGINAEEFQSYKFSLPTLLEQQKIAAFLAAIDSHLSLLERKKTLLEQYKKGLMQRIFSQELRFMDEDGREFPEWEEKKFGSLFSYLPTNSYSRSFLNYNEGLVYNIHYGDIHTKFKSNFDLTKEEVPFINKEVDLSRITSESYCKEGDLVIADASEDYADVGKTIELINLGGQKLIAGLHTFIARATKGEIALGFMGYLMQTRSVRLQVMRVATGISVLGISKGNLSKVKFQLPCFNEQQKIAKFLTAIDQKIALITTQIEKTKTYKKGLLQQLFV